MVDPAHSYLSFYCSLPKISFFVHKELHRDFYVIPLKHIPEELYSQATS